MSTFVVVGFMAIALLGVPIAFAMGLSAVIAIWLAGIDLSIIPQRMMYSVNSFPLMAIPFFMLSGELMIKAGIIERLISFANALVGRVRGGLAHVTMLSGAGLATVSGTAVSDASALSAILVPSLSKIYDKGFATAIVAAAANLGPIIPPSAAMIVYAFMAGPSVSVGGMFMAGVVPGVVITIGFMALCSWIATRRGLAYYRWDHWRRFYCNGGFCRLSDIRLDFRIWYYTNLKNFRFTWHHFARGHHNGRRMRVNRLRLGHHLLDDGRSHATKAISTALLYYERPDHLSTFGDGPALHCRHVPRV